METRVLIAGFGGQGILFFGKYIAYIGMEKEQQVSWLPSYGPEMRGGTAQCSVILSDTAIGSPVIPEADILVAMNLPSFLAFESRVKPGGTMFYDSYLITQAHRRGDLTYRGLPATKMAEENGLKGLTNMVMAGAALSVLPGVDEEVITAAMKKTIPERKKEMFESNMRAVMLGLAYPADGGQ
ncbi:MAG: 2-oxoacid:acceptor oxidoreductase family protein [Oscillospiraceae bacterium]|jgi:2-oxoglutarate ferredoxin oxidoreductase subunit gamma|nr:2-oxoacid:acceptor oxidoreductase family protein [Oscillospiraceae bacterium]